MYDEGGYIEVKLHAGVQLVKSQGFKIHVTCFVGEAWNWQV